MHKILTTNIYLRGQKENTLKAGTVKTYRCSATPLALFRPEQYQFEMHPISFDRKKIYVIFENPGSFNILFIKPVRTNKIISRFFGKKLGKQKISK